MLEVFKNFIQSIPSVFKAFDLLDAVTVTLVFLLVFFILDLLYKKSYDLIITDIMMPNVDGFQLVENVRQLNKDIPIIIMTAKEDFLSKQKGFNAGIDDYLVN